MALSPIAFIAPNYRDFKTYWLKAYTPGTTTPLPTGMALDSAGVVTVAKLQLNADGFLESAGGALVIPYIDGAYDLWLFRTEALADANDTTGAEQLADDITGSLTSTGLALALINDLSQAYEFPTVAAMIATTIDFDDDKVIHVLENDSTYTKITGVSTVDGVFVLQQTLLNNSFVFNVQETIFAEKLGIVPGSGQTTEIKTVFAYAYDNKIKLEFKAGTYSVNEQLLSKSTDGVISWSLKGVFFDYTGVEITKLFRATMADSIQIIGGRIQCNNLIANPVDLRHTASVPTGSAIILGLEIVDVKQTTLSTSAIGVLVSGEYAKITIQVSIDGISRVTNALACQGVVLIGVVGIANIKESIIKNISCPVGEADADAVVIIGKQNTTGTALDAGKVTISDCEFTDCKGRFIKSQHSNTTAENNKGTLTDNFVTIEGFRYADFQMSNGSAVNNRFYYGANITKDGGGGNSAIYIYFQNLKDVSFLKSSICTGNTLSAKTQLVYCVGSNVANGETYVQIADNNFGLHSNILLHNGLDGLFDQVSYHISDNLADCRIQMVDAGSSTYSKMFISAVNNTNTDTSTGNFRGVFSAGLNLGTNFVIANNKGYRDEVLWAFNTDDLHDGNSFVVGSQSSSGDPAGAGAGYHFKSNGFRQEIVTSDAVTMFQRVSADYGANWVNWLSATFT